MNHNYFQAIVDAYPADRSEIALEDLIDSERIDAYTVAELDSATLRYLHKMRALGVSVADRVMVQVEKSPQALFVYLACLRGGFIYLPLNTAYRSRELSYFIEDAQPSLILCTPQAQSDIEPLAGTIKVRTLGVNNDGSFADDRAEGADSAGVDETIVPRDADDIACILYTSGTTGQPKGALITHGNLTSNARKLIDVWDFQPSDVLFHALPLFHVHGLFVACGTALLNGSKMMMLRKFDVDRVIAHLPDATVFMGVPTFYVRLLGDNRFDKKLCARMRLFTAGSAPLLEETFNQFRDITGHTIVERYGMTETEMTTSNPVHGERLAGTVGPPLPGIEVRVVNDNGQVLPTGETGELQVRGDNVFKGYWRKPEKTAEEFTDDGWFKTGDLASIADNGYVRISGRAKDLIISGGFNVYPKEVELVIDEMKGVSESAVIGVPHADFGEAVTAVIVRSEQAPDNVDIDEAAVIAGVKSQLAGFKVPKRVHFINQLPRNTMGKVQKNKLREQFS